MARGYMRTPIILLLLLFLLLVTLPYLYATLSGDKAYVFAGILLNPLDGNSYLAKMVQGWQGSWRCKLLYSANPGEGAYLFLFYLFLGQLARVLNQPLVVVFHLARGIGAVVLFFTLFAWLKNLGISGRWLVWALTLALFGSGLGWLAYPFGVFTSDFWVAETYPFLSAYGPPHFSWGLSLMLLLMTIPYDASPSPIRSSLLWQEGIRTFLLAFLLAILAPFGIVIGLVALGCRLALELLPSQSERGTQGSAPETGHKFFALINRFSPLSRLLIVRWCAMLLAGVPWLAYDLWVTHRDPVFAIWNAQNLTPSPPVWDLLISLSPALLMALVGLWVVIRYQRRNAYLMAIWLVLGALLLYLPWGLQRRLMIGLFVPTVGLASMGIDHIASRLKRPSLLTSSLLLLALPTNLVVLATSVYGIQTHDPKLYLSQSEALALQWIGTNTPPEALILASPEMGLFIPAQTGRRVLYGHPFETANAQSEQEAVLRFFATSSSAQQSNFLSQRGIDYVFYGPRERQLGILGDLTDLTPAFSADGVVVYKVLHD